MSKVYELPSQDQRYDEAGRWIARLDRGLTGAEQRELQEWIAANPENEAVLFDMARLWDKMDALGRLNCLFPEPSVHRSTPRIRRAAWPLAASVLLAVALGLWAVIAREPAIDGGAGALTAAVQSDLYETAVGEQSSVTLADGTQITLNTNSRVRVRYTPDHRLLMLEKGELHVRVAEDRSRYLSIIAGDNVVQAVGTEFNIEITNDQRIELVVTEGKVRVGVHQRQADAPESPGILTSSAVTVVAGQGLILGAAEEVVTEVSPVDIEVKLSWRNGNLIFRGESLEEAVEEIGRYTSVEFVFLDEDLKKVRIAGLFKAGDIEGLLAALRENFDIAFERVDDSKILLSSE